MSTKELAVIIYTRPLYQQLPHIPGTPWPRTLIADTLVRGSTTWTLVFDDGHHERYLSLAARLADHPELTSYIIACYYTLSVKKG